MNNNSVMGDWFAVSVPKIMRRWKWKFKGNSSPHQGKQEKARRRRQIERGILKVKEEK